MNTELDPRIHQEFEQNRAAHEASVAHLDATLATRQRDIAEQAAKADAAFAAERAQLLTKVRQEYRKPEPESAKPRLVGWEPSANTSEQQGLMSFGNELDADSDDRSAPFATPTPPEPKPTAPAARHRRASEPDEDDYSEQSWLS